MDQLNWLETRRWRPTGLSLVTWSVAAFDQRKQEPRYCYLLVNQVRFVYHDIFFVFIHYPSAFSCTLKSQHIWSSSSFQSFSLSFQLWETRVYPSSWRTYEHSVMMLEVKELSLLARSTSTHFSPFLQMTIRIRRRRWPTSRCSSRGRARRRRGSTKNIMVFPCALLVLELPDNGQLSHLWSCPLQQLIIDHCIIVGMLMVKTSGCFCSGLSIKM